MNDLIELKQPNGDEITASEMYALILKRENELKQEFAAIEKMLDGDRWELTKPEWARLNKIDDELKDMTKATEKASHAFSKADRILVQLKATRKNLAAIHDRCWEKFVELRDADKPKESPSTFVVELTCRGKDFESIVAAAIKKIGRDNVKWGKAATDDAFVALKNAMKKMEA